MPVELGAGPSLPPGIAPRSMVVYLPYIAFDVDELEGIGDEDKGRAVFEAMRTHPRQERKRMVWDDTLARVAAEKVRRQAHEGWAWHVDPQGYGPNYYVRKAGYRLPDYYSKADDANNIESIAHWGDGTVPNVWAAWMASAGHKQHVLGLLSFYAAQTHVGCAYYYLATSDKKHYWAIISCPPEG